MADAPFWRRAEWALAALLLGGVVLSLLVEAGGPIASDDLWWHLSLGRAYLLHGPWLDTDPLLFSAAAAPAPHSWLFDLTLAGIAKAWGLSALRLVHVAAVAGIAVLTYAILRREAKRSASALAGTAIVLILMANRIGRLRPDLCSIAAAYALYLLLFEEPGVEGGIGWRRILAALLLLALWANLHALVAIGPLLLAAALLADVALRFVANWRSKRVREAPSNGAHRAALARRLALVLALGLLAICANPLGGGQLLSYLHARSASSLGAIVDDWAPFDPFHFSADRVALDRLDWLLVDALFVGFLLLAVRAAWRWWRLPDRARLQAFAPRLAALAAAALAAICMADRLLWLVIFPLLYLLHAAHSFETQRARRVARALLLGVAVVSTLGFASRWQALSADAAPFEGYLENDLSPKYPSDCVRFIAEAGLEGRLFSRYALGGFAGYWLAPRVKTLVNGSMNFDAATFDDYFAVANWRGGANGESVRAILDRRGIDLYLGSGLPAAMARRQMNDHSSADLDADPHFMRVYRTPECSVSLRRSSGNRDNLKRVRAWYRGQGVPFDFRRGFDVRRLLKGQRDWAIAQRMLPRSYAGLKRLVDSPSSEGAKSPGKQGESGKGDTATRVRAVALETLATLHLLLGDPGAALAFETRLEPRERSDARSLRRRIYAELQLGRVAEARVSVRELRARLGDSALVETFDAAVRAAGRVLPGQHSPGRVQRLPLRAKEAVESRIRALPVLDLRFYKRLIRRHLASPLPIPLPEGE